MDPRRRLAQLLDDPLAMERERSSIRFIVIDDHRIFSDGMRALAAREPDLALVAVADDVPGALAAAAVHPCEVVVVDVSLRGASGLTLAGELKRAAPQRRILMLSMHDEPDVVAASFASGADGYALKSQSPCELFEAIRAVAAGQRYLAPALQERQRPAPRAKLRVPSAAARHGQLLH